MWCSTLRPFILFTLLSALLAAAEYTPNYRTITLALATAHIQPQTGVKYALLEYWPAHTLYEKCWGDFSHVRLVVGELDYTPSRQLAGRTIEEKWDFKGTAWELTKDPGDSIAARVYGAPVANNEDRSWVANGYYQNRQLKTVQNQYVALGPVRSGLTATYIRNLGT